MKIWDFLPEKLKTQQAFGIRDKRIIKLRVPIRRSALVMNEAMMAWFRLDRFLYRTVNPRGMSYILDADRAVPLSPFDEYTQKELEILTKTEPIAVESEARYSARGEKYGIQYMMAITIRFAVAGIFIVFIVGALLVFAGKIPSLKLW